MVMTEEINQTKAEAFGEKVLSILNGGALGLMISIGHRTGLFDAMARLEPSTCDRIAHEAGLRERYVREWLGAMVTGGIVEYDPTSRTYHLPAEHAAMLTRAASPNNFAVTTQFLAVLGSVEDQIVQRFHEGGGVNYAEFGRFHEVMAEESAQTVVAGIFEHILPLVGGLTERLDGGIDVLDVGCGRGRALMAMAERFPRSRFTGFDFSPEAVDNANAEARRRGLENIRFEQQDAAAIDPALRFDLVTAFDAIHDQARPADVLDCISKVLRRNGVFLMQDIEGSSHVEGNLGHPLGAFMYTISCMHCMTVSLANDGAGLGAMWGRDVALKMLREAGFAQVEVQNLPHDIINAYYVARKA